MPYTPNASDAAAPLSTDPAGSAAAEFRALKAKVNGLDLLKADRAVVGGITYAITAGAVDSGGVGFRVLRIPNT